MIEKLYHIYVKPVIINKTNILPFIDSMLNKFIAFSEVPLSHIIMNVPNWFAFEVKLSYSPYDSLLNNKYGLVSIVPDNRKSNFVTMYSENKHCNLVLVVKVFY